MAEQLAQFHPKSLTALNVDEAIKGSNAMRVFVPRGIAGFRRAAKKALLGRVTRH
ncbi:hypothetical protein [Arthrobacter sp. NIO-1057]|uniref:hypothetical protein n=1 Tax=Arthrobacter sp. NIO-1057 TaxID=993071 RepID=UPI0012FC2AA1|nr:hypothetical protein [Arthrobacter sp. NIO-1057]